MSARRLVFAFVLAALLQTSALTQGTSVLQHGSSIPASARTTSRACVMTR